MPPQTTAVVNHGRVTRTYSRPTAAAISCIVSPSAKGLRPKARPSSAKTSFKTKTSPSQSPLRIITKPLVKVPVGASTPVSMKMSKP